MVKIGKIFGKKGKGNRDDASVVSTDIRKSARPSSPRSAPTTVVAAAAASSPAASVPRAAAPNAANASSSSPMMQDPPIKSKKSSGKLSVKRSKSKSPVVNNPHNPPTAVTTQDEVRDEAPSPVNNNNKFPLVDVSSEEDHHHHHAAENNAESASVSADEPSFEETMDDPSVEEGSDGYDEAATYDEDVSTGTGTVDDKSTFDEECTYDEATQVTQQTHENATGSSIRSRATAKGTDASKKYFHKDVVLNSLEDGANNLVIRAMYFIPKPKAEEHVVVKIEASTISARDCFKCKGHGVTPAMLPFVPGYEILGTIQTLGNQAAKEGQFREGDRVAGVSTFGGGNSRFISIPANRLTKISNNVKSTLAVCMIHDYMAALKALRLAKTGGSPFTGMNMLITDGFSPVGQAIINLASMEGANIYCCAEESKHSYLASIGAKCFIKDPEAWLPTASGTFDIVIDNSCVDSYSSSWFALTKKGSLVCLAPIYNIDGDEMPQNACGLDISELQQQWAGLKAQYMMTQTSFLNTITCYDDDTEQYKQDLRYLMFLLERGDIKPKVAERVSLDDVPDAQRLMQSGRANGTVVCVPWIEE